jgi:hypothetical protein
MALEVYHLRHHPHHRECRRRDWDGECRRLHIKFHNFKKMQRTGRRSGFLNKKKKGPVAGGADTLTKIFIY